VLIVLAQLTVSGFVWARGALAPLDEPAATRHR
jgi:hypothetical protein